MSSLSPRRLGGGAPRRQAARSAPRAAFISPSSSSPKLWRVLGEHPGGSEYGSEGFPMPRVLVVDDQKTIVETCRLYLEHAGFDVVVGFNGEQALAEARDSKPDLIVLDLMLPRVDGRDVCRRLRDEGVRVPIVMLTALAT